MEELQTPSVEDYPPLRDLIGALRLSDTMLELRATGESMLPLIKDGALLTVEPCGLRQVERGDIVVFWDRGRLSAHRYLFHVGRSFFERGDNCSAWAPCAPRAQTCLLGRVVRIQNPCGSWESILLDRYIRYGRFLANLGVLSLAIGALRFRSGEGEPHRPVAGVLHRIITGLYDKLIHSQASIEG